MTADAASDWVSDWVSDRVGDLVTGLDHVQVACPAGSEDLLRGFYTGVLGMRELTKPARLAARGGVWFRAGTCEIHCGVEADFAPARKAHPGISVSDVDLAASRVADVGLPVRWDDAVPGLRRFHTSDPVGNRIELQEGRQAQAWSDVVVDGVADDVRDGLVLLGGPSAQLLARLRGDPQPDLRGVLTLTGQRRPTAEPGHFECVIGELFRCGLVVFLAVQEQRFFVEVHVAGEGGLTLLVRHSIHPSLLR